MRDFSELMVDEMSLYCWLNSRADVLIEAATRAVNPGFRKIWYEKALALRASARELTLYDAGCPA